MIDVSPKFNTLRYALAKGTLFAKAETIARVKEGTVPKGDVLEVGRAAGITAAKRCSEWMVFCHNLPLDWIEIRFEVGEDQIKVFAEVKAIWKTGVEMEALSAVTGALLNMYDMLKPLDNDISLGNIKVVKKKGGKSNFQDGFAEPLRTGILVISDSTYAGEREDKSGKIIREFLSDQPVKIVVYEVLPDDAEKISRRLTQLVDEEGVVLIFTTGGTGLGPRDVTPQATKAIIDYEVPGIAEAMRRHGKERTPYAMLSREVCGVRKRSLIVNLPGSSRGAKESLEALFPGLLHAFPILLGGGH